MAASSPPERALLLALLGLTAVTGVVDAASYLALGHVFTANMTGNVVFLGFALAGAPGLSVPRCSTALGGFFIGALLGGGLAARMSPVGTGGRCIRTLRGLVCQLPCRGPAVKWDVVDYINLRWTQINHYNGPPRGAAPSPFSGRIALTHLVASR